jgi:hypothetical protein
MNQETREFVAGWGCAISVIGVSLLLWAALFAAIYSILWKVYQ